MSPLIKGFLIFALLYLIADLFVKQHGFGLFSHAINATLFGDEELYIDAISEASFLEFWHTEIFMSMMLVFTLGTISIRLSEASRVSILLVNTLFIAAFAALASLALAFYLDPVFVELYVAGYFVWHLCALILLLHSLVSIYRA
ncbi:MAG: hypothetical protein IE916_01655 [Epsilonproteobacteria bacterium]|nr:hypothetical protein [Campylobacterota bacterium]